MANLETSILITGGVSSSLGGSIRSASQSIGGLSKSAAGLAGKIKGLNSQAAQISQYRKLKRELSDLKNQTKRGGQEAEKARRQWRKKAERLRSLSSELKSAGIDTRRLSEHERDLAAQTARAEKSLGRMAKRAAMVRTGLKGLGRGIDSIGNKYSGMISAVAAGAVVRQVGNLQERFVRLGIQARMSTEEVDKLKTTIFETAQQQDIRIDPSELTAAIEKIVEKTGNLDLARDNIRNIGLAIQATGAAGADIGAMVADLQEKFGIKSKEEFLEALDTMVAQGKMGAFTLQNLATQGEKVTSAYAALGRTGKEGLREMGALLQMYRKGTGSPEQAADALKATSADLVSKASQIQKLGVEVWEIGPDGKQRMRSVPQLLKEIITETDGDLTKLAKIFGEGARNGVNALVAEYKKTGNLASMDQFLKVQGDGTELTKDATRAAETFNSAVTSLTAAWQLFADSNLAEPVQDLADAMGQLKPEEVQSIIKSLTIGAGVLGGLVAARKAIQGIAAIRRGVRGARRGGLGGMIDSVGGGPAGFGGQVLSGQAGVQQVYVVNMPAGGFGDMGGEGRGKKGKKGKGGKRSKSIGARAKKSGSLGKLAQKGGGLWGRVAGWGKNLFGKGVSKGAGKGLAKGLGKAALKKIPFIGGLAGLAFAAQRMMSGDLLGAGGEALSGLAGTLPGLGTAASIGLDTWLAGRDMAKAAEADAQIAAANQALDQSTTVNNSTTNQTTTDNSVANQSTTHNQASTTNAPVNVTVEAPVITLNGVSLEQLIQDLESGSSRVSAAVRKAVEAGVASSRRASYALG